ncbi:MAG: hypothetical protein Q8R50_01650, partial [Sediminibacterium sp.]|nr:hypothetical protein [Sediminibacterium sp.]
HQVTIQNNGKNVIDSAVINIAGQSLNFGVIEIGKSETKKFTILSESRTEGEFFGPIYLRGSDIIHSQFGYYSNTDDIKDNIVVIVDSSGRIRTKN